MRPISEAASRIAGKNFERKYVALGRLLQHWPDIVGADMASRTQPVKIHYRKKDKKISDIRLDIAASEAHATILKMQVGVIIERINRIFGDDWISAIRFVTIPVNTQSPARPVKKPAVKLDEEDQKYLASLLETLEDSDIKARLLNLGQAILSENKE